MGYQLNHVWKNQKLFKTEGQTKLESSLYYFTWEKELLPEDLLLRKVLFLKVCELLENTFPNLREGDKWNGLRGKEEIDFNWIVSVNLPDFEGTQTIEPYLNKKLYQKW